MGFLLLKNDNYLSYLFKYPNTKRKLLLIIVNDTVLIDIEKSRSVGLEAVSGAFLFLFLKEKEFEFYGFSTFEERQLWLLIHWVGT